MTSITADLTRVPLHPETRAFLEDALIGNVIDGRVVAAASGSTMPIIDPSTAETIVSAASSGQSDVDDAVSSAREAFDDGRWTGVAPLDKERRLRRLSELVTQHGNVLSDLDSLDAGLLKVQSRGVVQSAV